jgi:hypothetical protein
VKELPPWLWVVSVVAIGLQSLRWIVDVYTYAARRFEGDRDDG